ncbi:uncharacterized protein LOC116430690 [Nomia melanderi]|uniref:uncharacterized protein LOC116430690 n=1 Tax=Nomia melanderi TaxID=2448451 RepID=UPI00130426EB|nr:uncharacterized protein LOC116430690 [Nomia melanderi]
MSTPVLTKQQQRHTLSAKKTPAKGLRNVLAQPQDNFWPIVKGDVCTELEDILKRLMPAVRRPPRMIPWSQLKQMKKEERNKAKAEALLKQENVPNTDLVNSVILGINAITRSMEKDNVCCVLMDANIDPQLLIKHIIMMAQNKKIPILLLSNFKTILLNTIGLTSAACAFKNTVMKSPEHHFYPLYKKICDIFEDMPLPKTSLQLFKDTEPLEQSMLCKEDVISLKNESEDKTSESTEFTISTNVYKYRSSRKERIFIPPSATVSSINESTKEQIEPTDFISLNNYDSDEDDASIKKHTRYINIHEDKRRNKKSFISTNKSPNVTYLPLKVKRLQGNSNRAKATKVSKQKKK